MVLRYPQEKVPGPMLARASPQDWVCQHSTTRPRRHQPGRTLVVAGEVLEPQRRQIPVANHPSLVRVQGPTGSLCPPQRLVKQEFAIGQVPQQPSDLLAVPAQHTSTRCGLSGMGAAD
jgi:hypothetical protein